MRMTWVLMLSLYRQSMGDDIREIESQNRGLQILAQNQQKLSRDLDYLLVNGAYIEVKQPNSTIALI